MDINMKIFQQVGIHHHHIQSLIKREYLKLNHYTTQGKAPNILFNALGQEVCDFLAQAPVSDMTINVA
jgi:hypothetical protein